MILDGFTPAVRAAIGDKLSNALEMNPNVQWLINGVGTALGVSGDSYVSFPGIEGLDVGGYLPDGQDVAFDETKIRSKTSILEPMNKAFGVPIKQAVQLQKATDITAFLSKALNVLFPRTLFATFMEYMLDEAAKWGCLPVGYDTNSFDSQPYFSNSGYLDNLVAYTGDDAVSVFADYWSTVTNMLNATHPDSNEGYWEGVDTDNLQPVIIYPPELEETMKYVFTTEYFNNIVKGVTFNSEGENVLSRTKPVLRSSKRLGLISTTKWMVFFTSMKESIAAPPVTFFFNNTGLVGKHDSESSRRGVDISAGNMGNIIQMAVLGPGSTYYETKRKYGVTMNWYMGMLGTNRYRGYLVST